MRIFVAGATGVLGRPTVERLVRAGHQVSGVARRPESARRLTDQGATPIAVDLFDPAAVEAAVSGHDAVLNLATHIPPATQMWRPGAWAENHRLRSVAARHLAEAAGGRRFVQESIAFLYADGADAWLKEQAPVSPTSITRSALVAEGHALRTGDGVVLRFGGFYGPTSEQTRQMIALGRRGLIVLPGRPDGYLSWVHVDDAAAAVVAAVSVPPGLYNATDDEPLTTRALTGALGAALGRPAPRPVLGGLGRLPSLAHAARSLRVSNRLLRTAGDWQPRYPSVREGLAAVVEEVDRA